MELRYIRDHDKREVDFVVLRENKPFFAVEAKNSEKSLSPHIHYFAERTPIPKFYQVHPGSEYKNHSDKITMLPFLEFCKVLENNNIKNDQTDQGTR